MYSDSLQRAPSYAQKLPQITPPHRATSYIHNFTPSFDCPIKKNI